MQNWRKYATLGRVVAVMFVVGGLYHAVSPWLYGYQWVTPAAINHPASGLAVAALGAVRVVGGRWAWWATGLAAAVGVWLMISPLALNYGHHGFADNEALWGGGFTVLFAGLAGLSRVVTGAQAAEGQPG